MNIYERIAHYIGENRMGLIYFILLEAGGFDDEVQELEKHLKREGRQLLNLEKSSVINIDHLVGKILDKARQRYLS